MENPKKYGKPGATNQHCINPGKDKESNGLETSPQNETGAVIG